ncbi:MAG: hypothetical protein OEV51_03605, partial [Nitrospira sp.]|nr:hypothetical protein [Nitrospira sp.]
LAPDGHQRSLALRSCARNFSCRALTKDSVVAMNLEPASPLLSYGLRLSIGRLRPTPNRKPSLTA